MSAAIRRAIPTILFAALVLVFFRIPPQAQIPPPTGSSSTLSDIEEKVKGALIKAGVVPEPGFEKSLVLSVTTGTEGFTVSPADISALGFDANIGTEAKVQAGKDGLLIINYSEQAVGLQIQIQANGFAATRLHWDTSQGGQIPKWYHVRLARGLRIGGSVVDENGDPAANASIFLRSDLPRQGDPVESQGFDYIQQFCDAQGKWEIGYIPTNLLDHLSCAAKILRRAGSRIIHVEQDPNVAKELLAGTFVLHIDKPFDLTGVVADADGVPIPKANIHVFSLDERGRDFTSMEYGRALQFLNISTGSNGVFKVHFPFSGEYEITAEADGFAAVSTRTNILPQSPQRFVLPRGSPIHIRVVDQDGRPIPQARASLEWFGWSSMDHPENGPEPVRPQKELLSDNQGRIEWRTSAIRALEFNVTCPGYMERYRVKAVPGGPEATAMLAPTLVVSGRVTDAETGAPVPKFRVIPGMAEASRLNATNFSTRGDPGSEREFTGGVYNLPFDGSWWNSGRSLGKMLKFESDGYARALSQVIREDGGSVRLDIRLRPSRPKEIVILLPNGERAGPVWVNLVTRGGNLDVGNREFAGENEVMKLRADRRGMVALPKDDSISTVAVAVREGFGVARPDDLVEGVPWKLQPWGRIEGLWLSGDRPAVGREIQIERLVGWDDLGLNFESFRMRTGSDGAFSCDHVPPGTVFCSRTATTGGDHYQPDRKLEVKVRPGETARIVIGKNAPLVLCRFKVPSEFNGKELVVTARAEATEPPLPAGIGDNREARRKFDDSPEGVEFNEKRKHFGLGRDGDRGLVAEDVDPGIYTLSVSALPPGALFRKRPPFYLESHPVRIVIPATPPGNKVDLGEIALEKAVYSESAKP